VAVDRGAAPAAPGGRLEVCDLSVWFGTRRALDAVTLAVPPHAVTALVGPSGGGKSTLLRAVNRLVAHAPDVRIEGRVHVGGAAPAGRDGVPASDALPRLGLRQRRLRRTARRRAP
jgi:ABC-type polar amino acid transport system ATPase subunit